MALEFNAVSATLLNSKCGSYQISITRVGLGRLEYKLWHGDHLLSLEQCMDVVAERMETLQFMKDDAELHKARNS